MCRSISASKRPDRKGRRPRRQLWPPECRPTQGRGSRRRACFGAIRSRLLRRVAVMPADRAICFHHPDQKYRPDRDGKKGLDVGFGHRGIDSRRTEREQAEDTNDVEPGHDNALESIALGSTGDPLRTIGETTIRGTAAGVVVQCDSPSCSPTRTSVGKPDNLHQKILARPFFRYAEKDQTSDADPSALAAQR
jgi:hypothetical protein